ncbi:MAG: 6-chlorohydroxyquinol,2-dioxygenase [Bradyrhizobium sp.]|nr:6-chlorohydroxyquinol,2-dioxygenase [Bradyrhizobium sp.]
MRNLQSDTITAEVLRRWAGTPDPRLKAILEALIRHLHDFAREIDLTEDEWMQGILFLTRTGQSSNAVRQEFILLSDVLGLSQLIVAQNHGRSGPATEQTVLGPFHVENAPLRPHGYDIAEGADGLLLEVETQLVTVSGEPVASALVEVWHADPAGGYDTQASDWSIEHVRFRGNFVTDEVGWIRFRTTMPTSYPIPTDGPVGDLMRATNRSPMRPAHLHFRVAHPGYAALVTHVFDENDPHLDDDAVFGVVDSTVSRFEPSTAGPALMRLRNRLVLEPQAGEG